MNDPKKDSLAIPIAIIFGFGLIALAIFFSGNTSNFKSSEKIDTPNQEEEDSVSASPEAIRPISEDDHIRGNPNAPIMIVEYSDYDCPFCKRFHETMNRIMYNYGYEGRVGWVYRHFPISQLHPNAPFLAAAGECVAKLGGNDAFWEFTDLIFGERSENEQTNPLVVPEYVSQVGVDIHEYNTCVESDEIKQRVKTDTQNAITIGARGTPYSVVIVGNQQGIINGAQPYEVVKKIIDNLIDQLDGRPLDSVAPKQNEQEESSQ